ncbi:MAG: hypothetical protein NTV28_11300 [Propionibacteriales bacterium]|nr:hypothetical protein [Propionibacteriales bacterium]
MDDLTFDFRPSDVAAASARFPGRPSGATHRPIAADATVAVRERGTDFAQHAWDESGHL